MRPRRVVHEMNMNDAVLTVLDWTEQWEIVDRDMIQLRIAIVFRSRYSPEALKAAVSVRVPRDANGAERCAVAERARMQLFADAIVPVLR